LRYPFRPGNADEAVVVSEVVSKVGPKSCRDGENAGQWLFQKHATSYPLCGAKSRA